MASARTSCSASRPPSSAPASTRWRRHRRGRRRGARPHLASRRRTSTPCPARAWSAPWTGSRWCVGNARCSPSWRIDPGDAGRHRPTALRGTTVRPWSSSAVDGAVAGSGRRRRSRSKPPRREAIVELQRAGLRLVMLTGDSRDHGRGGRASSSASTRSRPEVLAGATRASRGRRAPARRAAAWRWPATASTTRRRWPRPTSASRWAPAPTWPCESAGITLRQGRPRAASCGRARCRRATMRNIRQNLFFAFVYNTLGVPIAAGVLYPFFGWSSRR